MDILRRLIQEELEKQLESESLAFSQHRVLDALEAWAVVRSLLLQACLSVRQRIFFQCQPKCFPLGDVPFNHPGRLSLPSCSLSLSLPAPLGQFIYFFILKNGSSTWQEMRMKRDEPGEMD